jgi:hypothetical protein
MSHARFLAPLWVVPLLTLSLRAQREEGGQLLPEGAVAPPVDLIQPVPAPEIPFGGVPLGPALPENLKIDNQGGKIEGNLEDGIRFGGPVKVQGDNGLEIFADRANLDLKDQSVTFHGHVSVYQGNLLQRGELRSGALPERDEELFLLLRLRRLALHLEVPRPTDRREGEERPDCRVERLARSLRDVVGDAVSDVVSDSTIGVM